jgi:hypothetical protein
MYLLYIDDSLHVQLHDNDFWEYLNSGKEIHSLIVSDVATWTVLSNKYHTALAIIHVPYIFTILYLDILENAFGAFYE